MAPKVLARLKSLELEEPACCLLNTMSTQPLIQRVTPILRDNQKIREHFQPISVAIGPLHHPSECDDSDSTSRVRRAEKFKLQLAAMFIKYSGSNKEDLYNTVKNHLSILKKCYDPDAQEKWKKIWDDEDLAWMFLVDGCAVLYFIYLDVNNKWEKLGGKIDLVAFAKLDLFLLENQLPFQLLQLLMSLCARVPVELGDKDKGKDSNTDKEIAAAEVLMDSIHRFIKMNAMSLANQEEEQPQQRSHQQQQLQQGSQQKQRSEERSPQQQQQQQQQPQQCLLQREQQSQQRLQQQQGPQQISILISDDEDPAHLLALLHRKLIGVKCRSKIQQQVHRSDGFWGTLKQICSRNRGREYTFRGATELKGKGIFLKAHRGTQTSSVTEIEFCDNTCMPTLKLHPILVDDSMVPKLLNLIAYEMCPDFRNDYEITTYVAFLDSLIDREEDVKELRVAGVLHNGLGSDEEVAKLFNRISDYLVPNPGLQYLDLQRRIQVHCNSVWASDLAQFYYTYFRTPWSFLVFVGAIAGLLLTALQTYRDFSKPASP